MLGHSKDRPSSSANVVFTLGHERGGTRKAMQRKTERSREAGFFSVFFLFFIQGKLTLFVGKTIISLHASVPYRDLDIWRLHLFSPVSQQLNTWPLVFSIAVSQCQSSARYVLTAVTRPALSTLDAFNLTRFVISSIKCSQGQETVWWISPALFQPV